jgi:formate hydrogenlyase transcriptional activator
MGTSSSSPARISTRVDRPRNESGLLSSESLLNILELIFAGSPLKDVLAAIARLVESQVDGMLCTIWLPDKDGKHVRCVAAPSLPGFADYVGPTAVGPKGASCGTAIYRREPVYVNDILADPIWDDYRDLMQPFGIRSVWSRPLFARDGKALGTFAMLYREVRSPSPIDIEIIENASHITGIAIERHINEEKLRHERDRLSLLLEITNSMSSKLDLSHLVRALSTNLLSVTRCDFCALLLPNSSEDLSVTILYNPQARGFIFDGSLVPVKGSTCGKTFRTGRNERIDRIEDLRDDPETFGSPEGQSFYERVKAEGLMSGCDFGLKGRTGIVGVLAALSRSEKAFAEDDFTFLEQVARQVAIAVENALNYEKAMQDRDNEAKQRLYLEQEIRSEFGAIIGESSTLKETLNLVSVVAPTDSTVLIQGETGTGKELIARAIHDLSARKERAFVKLNCAAIPLGLLESELFGHEKGAFTGAIAQRAGRFELADKGTLFLDEVGDIPLELQAKLLRVLQEQEFERLGSARTHKVDVRLIAATHRNLASMVRQGMFREDLYYRLRVFPVNVPPLRQRDDDIPKLARHFAELYARRMNKSIEQIPPETMTALVRYRWPGNVRELQNFIERAVILSPHTTLRAPISELESLTPRRELEAPMSDLAQVERDHIVRALEASDWVIGGRGGAAARLGMKRTSLAYRMKKLQIRRPDGVPRNLRADARASDH